jgi:hypothetical protein
MQNGSRPHMAASSYQSENNLSLSISSSAACIFSHLVLSNVDGLLPWWPLELCTGNVVPYVTEYLHYLIKQGAIWINKTTQAAYQKNTFQLVTAGSVPEGPIHQVENVTVPGKNAHSFLIILCAKWIFIGVSNNIYVLPSSLSSLSVNKCLESSRVEMLIYLVFRNLGKVCLNSETYWPIKKKFCIRHSVRHGSGKKWIKYEVFTQDIT